MSSSNEGGSAAATTQSPDQLQQAAGSPPQRVQSVRQQPQRRPSSPNASSVPITQASGDNTHGRLNQHPNVSEEEAAAAASGERGMPPVYKVGVSEDRNKKCRRTMEDSHAFVYDFGGVKVRLTWSGDHARGSCEGLTPVASLARRDKATLQSLMDTLASTLQSGAVQTSTMCVRPVSLSLLVLLPLPALTHRPHSTSSNNCGLARRHSPSQTCSTRHSTLLTASYPN